MIYDGPYALNPFLKLMQTVHHLDEYFVYLLLHNTMLRGTLYGKDGCLSPIHVLVKMFFSSSDSTELCKIKLRFKPNVGCLFGNVEYVPDVRRPNVPIRT